MKINNEDQLQAMEVKMEGVKGVTKKVLVGRDQGSEDIVMRLFTIMPGGNTPFHSHDFEHLVRIEKGRGMALDADGNEHEVGPGQSLFVPSNVVHGFKNPYSEPFEFICVVPARGEG